MNVINLPGTTIEVDISKPGVAGDIINSIFLGGGLILSQITGMTGMEPYIVQNWVKRGFVPSPRGKKYSKQQFCRIILINFLRDCMQLEKIVSLIQCINGNLADERDDRIDDCYLYCLFADCIARVEAGGAESAEEAVRGATENVEASEDTKKRLNRVLNVMCLLYVSTMYLKRADRILMTLEEEFV